MNPRIRQFLREEWLQLLILVLTLIAALAAMPYATERVPMQWNLRGEVNWYAPKEWGLLVLPGALFVIYPLLFFLEGRDRNRRKPEDGSLTSHGKATRTIRLTASVVLAAVCFIQIACALGRHLDVARLVPTGVALLLAFIGNLFGKLKPNRYVGIRVPWTLNSETVWRKTHRLAGWLYTVSGLVVAAITLLSPVPHLPGLMFAWVAMLVVVPLVVAWEAARSERRQNGTAGDAPGAGKYSVVASVLILLAGCCIQYLLVDPKHEPQRRAAQAAAEQWLVNLDDVRYEDAWKRTAGSFRSQVKEASLVKSLNGCRKPAGATKSRQLREASYKESLPHAPTGRYVIVQFDTVFDHKPDAIETVVEEQETDGRWQVSGYFIK